MSESFTARDWAVRAQAAIDNEALRRVRDEARTQALAEALHEPGPAATVDEVAGAGRLRLKARLMLRLLADFEDRLRALAAAGQG